LGAEFDFAHLIRPLEAGEFAARYWEQQPLVVQREQPDYYEGLFSMEDVEHIVSSTGIRYPGIRLVKNGSPLPTSSYTSNLSWGSAVFTNLAETAQVLDAYRHGATLILQALHRNWKPLARFCRTLEHYFSYPVQANAYLTPESSQGFAPHYDTHDVFVLQVAGHKHWRIYDSPVLLPDRTLPYSASGAAPGELLHELVLEPGDLIYLPRGFIHEALTTRSESLHITVGVVPYTWIDLFTEAVQRCREDPRFRKALPVGFVTRDELSQELRDEFESLLAHFPEHAALDEILDGLAERFVSSRAPVLDGPLLKPTPDVAVEPETLLRRARGIIYKLSVDGERAVLLFNGKRVAFPGYVAPSLRHVAGEKAFRVREIAGSLDEAGKLTLARRLLKEGFLTLV
jgi:ribosomal protein L16 Arg81 hydroxylase